MSEPALGETAGSWAHCIGELLRLRDARAFRFWHRTGAFKAFPWESAQRCLLRDRDETYGSFLP